MQELVKFYRSLTVEPSLLLFVSSLLLSASTARLFWCLTTLKPLAYPQGGHRGAQRRLACRSPFFLKLEPGLRLLGAAVEVGLKACQRRGGKGKALAAKLLTFQKRQLIWAGEPLGLEARETIALSLILFLVGGSLGALWGGDSDSWIWIAPGGLFFLVLPNIRLQALATSRFGEMSRELPASVDLMAMAMNAGSDFPGALRRVVEGQKGVVADELRQVLLALELGITRSTALVALRERVPTSDVRDLVRAVLMAERKGSSLSDALAQQACTSRQRRSERAEEAAARAGVLLLFPLMLLMACIMILLVGPLLSSGLGI